MKLVLTSQEVLSLIREKVIPELIDEVGFEAEEVKAEFQLTGDLYLVIDVGDQSADSEGGEVIPFPERT